MICPYCGIKIVKEPTRKFKCQTCKNEIYVHGNRDTIKLLTKKEYESIEIERKIKYEEDNFFKFFEDQTISKEQLTSRKIKWFQKYKEKASYDDLIWSVSNELLDKYAKSEEFHAMKMLYLKLALYEMRNNRVFFHLLQQVSKMQLLGYKKEILFFRASLNGDFNEIVEISVAHNSCCENCEQLAGKRYTIDEAREKMPIPLSSCTHENGFCRCIYLLKI